MVGPGLKPRCSPPPHSRQRTESIHRVADRMAAALRRALRSHLRPAAPPAASTAAAAAAAVYAPAARWLLSSTTEEAKGEVADGIASIAKNFQKVEPAKHSPLSGFLDNAMGTGTRESSNQDRILEENKEFQQFRQRFDVHNTYNGGTRFQTSGGDRSSTSGGSPSFMRSWTFNDKNQFARKSTKDFVHVLLKKKKTFVTVTDAKGNKKTGASAGCLEDRKGQSRSSRYAAEATAEHVGRSARKMGLKSVVMKVKGFSFFGKKKKVILGFSEGFRGERVRDQSPVTLIHDVTQLPHNGCRLPKQRRT